MKRFSFSHKNLSAVFLITALFMHCASVHKNYYNELIPRYPGTAPLSLADSSLIEGLNSILFTFGDTLTIDTIAHLWNDTRKRSPAIISEPQKPQTQNLFIMAALLRDRGYTVATVHPDSYESLFALSKLPLLIWTLIIHHRENRSNFITNKELTLYHTSLLSPSAGDLQLHLISNIRKSDATYKIITHDGLTLPGLATDHLNTQILSGDKNTTAKYLQIVDCIIVSLLPLIEIQEHINEWYSTTSYKYVKPEIKELQ